jgi:hypothetical protein
VTPDQAEPAHAVADQVLAAHDDAVHPDPVQVLPFHDPPVQDVALSAAVLQAAGAQGRPMMSFSPTSSTPLKALDARRIPKDRRSHGVRRR